MSSCFNCHLDQEQLVFYVHGLEWVLSNSYRIFKICLYYLSKILIPPKSLDLEINLSEYNFVNNMAEELKGQFYNDHDLGSTPAVMHCVFV